MVESLLSHQKALKSILLILMLFFAILTLSLSGVGLLALMKCDLYEALLRGAGNFLAYRY